MVINLCGMCVYGSDGRNTHLSVLMFEGHRVVRGNCTICYMVEGF